MSVAPWQLMGTDIQFMTAATCCCRSLGRSEWWVLKSYGIATNPNEIACSQDSRWTICSQSRCGRSKAVKSNGWQACWTTSSISHHHTILHLCDRAPRCQPSLPFVASVPPPINSCFPPLAADCRRSFSSELAPLGFGCCWTGASADLAKGQQVADRLHPFGLWTSLWFWPVPSSQSLSAWYDPAFCWLQPWACSFHPAGPWSVGHIAGSRSGEHQAIACWSASSSDVSGFPGFPSPTRGYSIFLAEQWFPYSLCLYFADVRWFPGVAALFRSDVEACPSQFGSGVVQSLARHPDASYWPLAGCFPLRWDMTCNFQAPWLLSSSFLALYWWAIPASPSWRRPLRSFTSPSLPLVLIH